jgi:cysteine synthase
VRRVERTGILRAIGGTPLVPLAKIGAELATPVLVKCEHLNPGGSVKDRIALSIVEDAERRRVLVPGQTIVEATAGNTGLGLAIVAAQRGYRLACVLPEKMSMAKRAALAALGAEVIVTPNAPPDHADNFQRVARRLADERGWFLADQFCNPANVSAHEHGTGPEILAQAGGRVGAFVAGVGTGGTLTGVGRYLKARLPSVQLVLADPVGSLLAHAVDASLPAEDRPYLVEGIGSSRPPEIFDARLVDRVERVSDDESFAMARRLMREEGLLVGGSAGTAVVAALRVAARGGVDGPVVTLLPDSWDRYFGQPWLTLNT